MKGVITYTNPQSRASFDAARNELRQRGINYRLRRLTAKGLRRPWHWPHALLRDLRCLAAASNADFLVLNSGAALLHRPRLTQLLIAIQRRRRTPTFVLWHSCRTILGNVATRLGTSRFRRAAQIMAAEGTEHLAVSQHTGHDVINAIGVERVRAIYNSVALADGYDSRTTPDDHPPVVLNVASVQHRKGPDLFIEVAAMVAEEHPSTKFVWVGGKATPELQKRIHAHGLDGRVEFVGEVFPPYEWIQRASVVLLPSRTEAFGRIAAEAMACYRTVCCFEGTGVAEVIGDTGVASPKFDLDGMARDVLRVLRAPVEVRVNHAARKRYEDRFSPARFAEGFAALMHSQTWCLS